MTVATNYNKVTLGGNGATTVFPYPFKIFANTDLVVTHTDSSGVEAVLVLDTDYTVSGAGDDAGGNVTYPVSGSPLPSGETLTILRSVDEVQLTDLKNQGAWLPEVIEDAFDKIVMMIQQLGSVTGDLSRTLRFKVSEDRSLNTNELPAAIDGKVLGWGTDGDLANIDLAISTTGIPFVATAALLKAVDVTANTNAFIRGKIGDTDGFQDQFHYSAASTLAPDDERVILPNSVTLPAPGRWLFVGVSDNSLVKKWIRAEQVGTDLNISGSVAPAIAALNGTDIAYFDKSIGELRTYRFSGNAFAIVGSGLAIATTGAPALTALNDTDVAFFDATNEDLRLYRFNVGAGTWSQIGSDFNIPGAGAPALTALNDTDVAFFDSLLEELRAYRFNVGAGTWSQIGNSLSIPGAASPAMTTLNNSSIAWIDATLQKLRKYGWDGADFTLIGSELSFSGLGFLALASLNNTDIAFYDSVLRILKVYRFGSSSWTQVGNGLSIISSASPAIAALNGTDIAYFDDANEDLRCYRFAFSVGYSPYLLTL